MQDEERLQHTEKNDKPGSLRADGEESGHWRGSALINVRHPNLKWYRRNFESQADQCEQQTQQRGALVRSARRKRVTDLLEIRLAGNAEDPGDAVYDEPGGHRTENQILHASLQGRRVAPGETDQYVKRDRHQLERDEDHDQVDGGHQIHQPRAGEDWQGEKLAQSTLRGGIAEILPNYRHVIDRHEQHKDRGREHDAFEYQRGGVSRIKAPESSGCCSRHRGHVEGGNEYRQQTKCADQRNHTGIRARRECSEHQHHYSEQYDRDLDVSGWDHGAGMVRLALNAGETTRTNVCGKNPNQRSPPINNTRGRRSDCFRSSMSFQRSGIEPMNVAR